MIEICFVDLTSVCETDGCIHIYLNVCAILWVILICYFLEARDMHQLLNEIQSSSSPSSPPPPPLLLYPPPPPPPPPSPSSSSSDFTSLDDTLLCFAKLVKMVNCLVITGGIEGLTAFNASSEDKAVRMTSIHFKCEAKPHDLSVARILCILTLSQRLLILIVMVLAL